MVVSRFGGVLVLLGSVVATPVFAGELSESAARVLFVEARELVEVGDYAAACAKFDESYKLDPGIGTSFNLADCQEHLGRTASAWARFLSVAAATRAAGQKERERVALARVASLGPRLSRLAIAVPAPPPSGLTIKMDGEIVPSVDWGVAVPVDPGRYTVEATAPGKVNWSTVVVIAAEAAGNTVTITVPGLADSAQPPPPGKQVALIVPDAAPTSAGDGMIPSSAKRRLSKGAAVLGSIGALGLVSALVFAIKFEVEDSEARSLCVVEQMCLDDAESSRHESLVTAARRDRSIFYLSTAVGSAASMLAFYLWWRSGAPPSADSARASQISLRPLISRSGLAAALEVDW